jgi:anti-sigma factor RsiW
VLTCAEFVERVTAYLEAALDPDTHRRFVAHAAACHGCGRYLGQIRATMDALAELPADSLSSAVRDRLRAAFRERRG